MTLSGKKAAGKSPARGAGKTSARSPAKKSAAPQKAALSKKRVARKKKSSSGRGPYLAAFAAGLLAAVVCFWGIHQIVSRDQVKTARPSAVSSAARTAENGRKSSARPEDKAERDRQRAETRERPRSSSQPQLLPPVGDRSPDSSVAPSASPGPEGGARPGAAHLADSASRGPGGFGGTDDSVSGGSGSGGGAAGAGSPASGASGADAASGGSSAVAGALLDLQSLPYEESLGASLDERIRQVDYAVMQAAWMFRLPASSMRLAAVENRLQGVEPYFFQTIDVLPGPAGGPYVKSLRESLKAWAGSARLKELRPNQWGVFLGGVQTHLLRLHPGRAEFLPLEDGTGGQTVSPALPSTLPDGTPAPAGPAYPPRTRQSGEPARMVIVIDDLGASMPALRQLAQLSYPVTFAFWPHSAHAGEGAEMAHALGREILIHQPMEPLGYPKVRPGPGVLLTGMDAEEIARQITTGILRVPHAVGLNNHMGSRFTQSKSGVDAVLAVLKRHGLFALDSVTHRGSVFAAEGKRLGVVTYHRNVFLDVTPTRAAIIAELRRAERIALLTGQSVAIGHPLPETLEALREWQRLRDPSVELVRLRDIRAD